MFKYAKASLGAVDIVNQSLLLKAYKYISSIVTITLT
jgi:hypothetical protein